ncbi:Uncharacterised protein [Escherichia albertii]|nr:Uncharacterised protein [Escherichia coli]
MSASRSKRTRRLACVGLGVFKEVLVVTGCRVPFLQNKITETIPNSCIESLTRQPHIYQDWCTSNTMEVVVLVLKCALAIAAVMAIYCLAVVLMDRLSD